MLKKLILVYALIFSYAGAVMHSIVPHHHHKSQQEAKEQHHHDHHHDNHSHGQDQHKDKNHEHENSPYLLSHTANADVLVNHAFVDTVVKNQKADKKFALPAELSVLSLDIPIQVFHPPSDALITHSTAHHSSALRAPPASFI